MIPHQLLGKLSNIHELICSLVQDMPANEVNRRFHPDLPSIGWLLGRSIYLETYWLRERISNDDDLTRRVRHIFGHAVEADERVESLVPPKDHLLNWALEIMDEHLSRLANPGMLPEHPWLREGWIVGYLVQVHGQTYEKIIEVLAARSRAGYQGAYQVSQPLIPQMPMVDMLEVSQGHYRVGAREGVVFDNEQPMQMVELHNYRIARSPVSNAEYLSFMQDGGYAIDDHWTTAGRLWKSKTDRLHPLAWRGDANHNWYSIGLNGPADLLPTDPVTGISQHEATAYANWASARVKGFKGALLQHEYQWEAAARTQGLSGFGRAWEWCSNPVAQYDGYEQPVDEEMTTRAFDNQHICRRGGCMHTQPSLRRISYRQWGLADSRHPFTGARLVLPPSSEGDELYISQWKKFLVNS